MPDPGFDSHDHLVDAVAEIVRRGGAVEIGFTATGPPLKLAYAGRAGGRVRLRGKVEGLADAHGFGLGGLGWTQRSGQDGEGAHVDRPTPFGRTVDHRARYERDWELPPATAAGVAADVRATIEVITGRSPAHRDLQLRFRRSLDEQVGCTGLLLGFVALLVGSLLAAFLVIIPRDLGADLATRAGIAGLAAWFGVGMVTPWLAERLPGARDHAWLPYLALMLIIPPAVVIAWALYGF